MNNRLFLIASMIVLVFALPAAASDRTMYVEYIPMAEFDHGKGFDAAALEVMAQCVEGTVKSLGGRSQSVNSELSQVETSSQLDESLGIGAAASLGYGAFKMSASAKYAQSHSLSSFALTYAAKSAIESETLALDSPRLKEEFATMKISDYPRFRRICGDYYVDGITKGGEYIAMVTVTTESSQDKQDIAAQLNAAVNMMGSASLSVDFEKSMKSVSSKHEVNIKEIRKGGAGEPIAIDAATMLANFRNFANSVDQNPASYEVILKKYSTLPNYPFDSSDPLLESALGTIETLADLNHAWSTILNDIGAFKNRPKQFRGEDPATLARWEGEVRSVLSTLSAAMATCAGDYSKCSVPSLGRQPNDYRDRYPEWKPDIEWVRVDSLPGAVRQVAVGSKDTVWALLAGQEKPKRLTGDKWVDTVGDVTSMSIGADGTVWAVNRNQDIFRWEGNGWAGIGTGKLVSISVGSANSIFGVNAAGAGFQWNGRNWDALPIPMPLEQIAAGSDGSIALRSRSGDVTLFGRNLSEMKPIVQDRVIVDVAVGNKDTVYFIDANGDLFRWGGEGGKIGGSLGKFTKVSAASDGTVWVVNGQGQMFKLENL